MEAERDPGGESANITITWMQPQNFVQFDIDHYDISVTSTSGVQLMTTACGECTNTTITVSEDPNNVQISTTYTVTIAAVNLCGDTGPTATASDTLSKLYYSPQYYSCYCYYNALAVTCYVHTNIL